MPSSRRTSARFTGPGWPILTRDPADYSPLDHERNFDSIQTISNGLRQARVEICSPGGGAEFYVRELLKGVRTAKDASVANLALQVLSMQSGGQTLNPGNSSRLQEQLNACAEDAGAYYTLSFDPPMDARPYEYHALKVEVDKPGMKVRTSAGYYMQP